jgi:hypothetical protein
MERVLSAQSLRYSVMALRSKARGLSRSILLRFGQIPTGESVLCSSSVDMEKIALVDE